MPYSPPIKDILELVFEFNGPPTADDPATDRPLIEAVLASAADFARNIAAPAAIAADREGCRFSNGRVALPADLVVAIRRFIDGGWTTLNFPVALGGQGLPGIVQVAVAEMLNGACLPLAMLALTTRGAAKTLMVHGNESTRGQFLLPLIDGSWSATICVTEPNAGSDVGRLTTRAVPIDGERYELTGQKIFISFADHDATEQIVHMALARIVGSPPGPQGLSLFAVPKRLPAGGGVNRITVLGIEHKMGLHGSPTCAVALDGAVGWLIGDPGRGLQAIFTMINTMRLEVAVQGVAVSGAAYQLAVRYAAERRQGGRPDAPAPVIGEHPDVRRMLMTMRALVDGSRALIYEVAFQVDRAEVAPCGEERAEARQLAAWLLPICKAWCSDVATEVTSMAVQVHGGHGYVRETGVERHMRDARIMPIYEGTNGIQAIDLVTRKLGAEPSRFFGPFVARVRRTVAESEGYGDVDDILSATARGIDLLDGVAQTVSKKLVADPMVALAGATPFLTLAGKVAVAWCWLRLAGMSGSDAQRAADRRALARFYALWLMPDIESLARQALLDASSVYGVPFDRLAH